MKLSTTTAMLACIAGISLCVLLASNAQALRQRNNEDSENEIDDDRIAVPESVKMFVKVSYLGILESMGSTVPAIKYIKSDTGVEYFGRLANALTKKSILWPTIEVLAALVSAVSAILFFFPSTFTYLESKYKVYEKFLYNNSYLSYSKFDPEAILEQLSRSSDDALDRWGISDKSCRERSICEIGDIIACYIPGTIDAAKKYIQGYLPSIDFSRNRYTRAFIIGLNHTSCGETYKELGSNCPGLQDWMGTYFWGNNPKKPTK